MTEECKIVPPEGARCVALMALSRTHKRQCSSDADQFVSGQWLCNVHAALKATKLPLRDLKPRTGKAPLHLLPARPLRAIAAAFLDGAIKYKPWNWTEETPEQRETYGSALARHVAAFNDTTVPDVADDSGLHHIAHAGACCMIILFKEGVDFVMPKSWKGEG